MENSVWGGVCSNGGICNCGINGRQKKCKKRCFGRKDFMMLVAPDDFIEERGSSKNCIRYCVDPRTKFFFSINGYEHERVGQLMQVLLNAVHNDMVFDFNFGYMNDFMVMMCVELNIDHLLYSKGNCFVRGNMLKDGIDIIFSSIESSPLPLAMELNFIYYGTMDSETVDSLRDRINFYPRWKKILDVLCNLASDEMYRKNGFMTAWTLDCELIKNLLVEKWEMNKTRNFYKLEDIEFLYRLFKKGQDAGSCMGNCLSGIVGVLPFFKGKSFSNEKGCLGYFARFMDDMRKHYDSDSEIPVTGLFSKNVVNSNEIVPMKMLEWLDNRRRKFKLIGDDEVHKVREALTKLNNDVEFEWGKDWTIDTQKGKVDKINLFVKDMFHSEDESSKDFVLDKLELEKESLHQLGQVFYSMKEIKSDKINLDRERDDEDQSPRGRKIHNRKGYQNRMDQVYKKFKNCSCFSRYVLMTMHSRQSVFRRIVSKLVIQKNWETSFWGWFLDYKNASDRSTSDILTEVFPPELMERLNDKKMVCVSDYVEKNVDVFWLEKSGVMSKDNPIYKVYKGCLEGKSLYLYTHVSKYGL